MKQYTKLPIPKDSAWDRKTWRSYTPIWLKQFIDGLSNIIRWIPIIYKDKDWDDFYITKMLQKKIEFQREHLVKHNRHTHIDIDNRNMTWVLNLIERKHHDYYSLEKYDYEKSEVKFTAVKDRPGISEMNVVIHSEEWDKYLSKYKGAVRRIKKLYPNKDLSDKRTLVHCLGVYNQERCKKLIWRIMEEKSEQWWD